MYFEEFQPGLQVITGGRTITEADIVSFAGLSGDYTRIHTDAEYCKTTPFGQRVAHGLLGLSIASGLAAQTGILEGTVLAFREILEWKFVKPIFIGDTVHAELEVRETKAYPRLNGGGVIIAINLVNQHGETLMKGLWNVLFMNRPEAMAEASAG
jgi:acyl dehydratase